MSVAAVILAAGASTRMGRPKALLEWNGRPFFVSCIELARAAGCDPVVVVDGAVSLAMPEGARRVHNGDWQRGPLSSLQRGVDAVLRSPGCTGVVVLTVDRPHVAHESIRALVEAHVRGPRAFVQVAHAGRSGHPVLYPRALAESLLELAADDSPRTLLRRPEVRAERILVPVADSAVLDNIDTPQDYAELQRR